MVSIEAGLYLRVEELPNGPTPFPLRSGFSLDTAYRALGLYNPSETSDAYFILSNDRDEIWFICNRHLRCVGLLPGRTEVRLPLSQAESGVSRLPEVRDAPDPIAATAFDSCIKSQYAVRRAQADHSGRCGPL